MGFGSPVGFTVLAVGSWLWLILGFGDPIGFRQLGLNWQPGFGSRVQIVETELNGA